MQAQRLRWGKFQVFECEENSKDGKAFCLEKQTQGSCRGMHVIEEEVGPFSEVGPKPEGKRYGSQYLYMEATLPHKKSVSLITVVRQS